MNDDTDIKVTNRITAKRLFVGNGNEEADWKNLDKKQKLGWEL